MPVLYSAPASKKLIIGPYGPKNGAGHTPTVNEIGKWEEALRRRAYCQAVLI
jgi:hypothetical protein